MIEIVLGEDGDGAVCGEAAIEEGLADSIYRSQNSCIGELAPFAVRFPFGNADFVWGDFRPVREAVGENFRVRSQRFVGTNQHRSIRETVESCAGSAQAHGADAIVSLGFSGHFSSFQFIKTGLRISSA